MAGDPEAKLLDSVALQNATSVLQARLRGERELLVAKEALEGKSAELALAVARLRATLDATTDGIIVTDSAGRVTDGNETYAAMWHLERAAVAACEHAELARLIAPQLIAPEGVRRRIAEIDAASPAESLDVLELKDGRVIERSSRIQFVDGRNAGRVWSFRDITVSRRAELAQREEARALTLLYASSQRELAQERRAEEASRRLAAIVESSDDAIFATSLEGEITTWNAGAERMFGYAAAEILGRSILTLVPGERQSEEPAILQRVAQGERVEHYETLRRRKDGTTLDVSLSVSPIKDQDGRVVGVSKIARDIGERRRAAEALEQLVLERTASLREAISQMEEFSYSVSHDLRSPARAMNGYAGVLLEDYGERLDEAGRGLLRRIQRSAGRMDQLIRDLLTYSRLTRRELEFTPVRVEKLIAEVMEQYPEMQAARADIAVEGPIPDVIAHEPSLTQVISNLLSNAVKFVRPGERAEVTVHGERRGAAVRICVADRGIGVKPASQARLFGLFERVHPEQHYAGTGIGLAIVRKAMERMNGRAGLESDGVSGATFWIELPAAPQA